MALAYIRFDMLIPLLLAFDGTAAPVQPHALEVQPDRNQDDVGVADNSSINYEKSLELDSHNIDNCRE